MKRENIEGPSTNGKVLSLSSFRPLQSSCRDGSGKPPWLKSRKKKGEGDPARFGYNSHPARLVQTTTKSLFMCPEGGLIRIAVPVSVRKVCVLARMARKKHKLFMLG